MTRRELLRSASLFGASVIASRGLLACAFDSNTNGEEPLGEGNDALVRCQAPTISANHGHSLVVSSADVAAGRAKTYSIKGSSLHDHQVTITAAQFTQLAAGRSVTALSTNNAGHTHNVTVTCTVVPSPTVDAGADASSHADASHDGDAAADASSHDDGSIGFDADASAVCSQGATATSISVNHGHTLFVPRADIAANVTKTYSIQGSAGHAHSVTITAAQLGQLRAGASISLTSTSALGHLHTVVVLCV